LQYFVTNYPWVMCWIICFISVSILALATGNPAYLISNKSSYQSGAVQKEMLTLMKPARLYSICKNLLLQEHVQSPILIYLWAITSLHVLKVALQCVRLSYFPQQYLLLTLRTKGCKQSWERCRILSNLSNTVKENKCTEELRM
jgi:hypothetical protein